MAIDELQHVGVGHDRGGRELLEEREHFGSSRHLPAGQLALDEWMPQHQPLGEPGDQPVVPATSMIDPAVLNAGVPAPVVVAVRVVYTAYFPPEARLFTGRRAVRR